MRLLGVLISNIVGTVLVYEGVRMVGFPVLPTSLTIYEELVRNSGRLFEASLYTLFSVFLSLVLTLPFGIALGYILSISRLLHDIMMPFLITLKSLPTVALLPLLIVLFKRPYATQIILTASICFLPITIAVTTGLRSPSGALRHFALVSSSSASRIFMLVTVPAAASELLLGFKVSLPLAFVGTMVAEMSSAEAAYGLGNTILTANNYSNFAMMIAAIIAVAITSTGTYLLLLVSIKKLLPANGDTWF